MIGHTPLEYTGKKPDACVHELGTVWYSAAWLVPGNARNPRTNSLLRSRSISCARASIVWKTSRDCFDNEIFAVQAAVSCYMLGRTSKDSFD